MNKEYITRLIYEYNPQIRGEKIEVPMFRRDLYSEIEKWLEKKQIIGIVGLRRTGKTTIMKQIIENVGGDVAFFSFDEEETQKKEILVFVIDFFLNNFKPKYIFLDEIHYVTDWEGVLKRYYDLKNIKFIVSGSESLELSRAKETLAGRIITFRLGPLTFREFLGLKGKKIALEEITLDNISIDTLEKFYIECVTEKEFFENEFLDYLYKGGFPELTKEQDETIIRRYIYELVVKKIIYRDIPSIFDIRRRDLLFELLRYACDNSSNLFEIRNLCNTFNANYETISNYLFYLRSAFLIKVSESYSKSLAKRIRRNKKMYIAHPSIAFAVLGYGRNMVVGKILGPYVETLFASEFFWRDKHKNEVDVVLKNKTLIPIEIKYQSQIAASDMNSLFRFMKKFKVKRGILITKDLFEYKKSDEKEILFIPAWLFLLAVEQKNK